MQRTWEWKHRYMRLLHALGFVAGPYRDCCDVWGAHDDECTEGS